MAEHDKPTRGDRKALEVLLGLSLPRLRALTEWRYRQRAFEHDRWQRAANPRGVANELREPMVASIRVRVTLERREHMIPKRGVVVYQGHSDSYFPDCADLRQAVEGAVVDLDDRTARGLYHVEVKALLCTCPQLPYHRGARAACPLHGVDGLLQDGARRDRNSVIMRFRAGGVIERGDLVVRGDDDRTVVSAARRGPFPFPVVGRALARPDATGIVQVLVGPPERPVRADLVQQQAQHWARMAERQQREGDDDGRHE